MNTRPDRPSERRPGTVQPGGGFRRRGTGLLALGLAATLAIGGCGGKGAKGEANQANPGDCPKVSIVRDLAQISQFRPGPSKDPTDLIARAALVDFRGKCDPGKDQIAVDFDLALIAERGPALRGNQASFQYFVAVIGPDNQRLAKEEFVTAVEFAPGTPQVGSKEELSQTIPLAPGRQPGDYQVIVGFQLSPDQLDYNRRTVAR